MKGLNHRLHHCFVLFVLAVAAAAASGQCPKPDQTPKWNPDKAKFMCSAPASSKGPATEEAAAPTGDKKYCSSARDNLVKACPAGDEGKACRSEAKAVFNSCYKSSKETVSDHPTADTGKTDTATCMNIYTQAQKACAARKPQAVSPGQSMVPDTCMQDAIAAQNRCLANSH